MPATPAWRGGWRRFVRFYEYDDSRFFRVDGAPDDVAARRRAGFMRLSELYQTRFAKTAALTAEAADGISDLQFTAAYRVPFQFRRLVRAQLKAGAFVQSSAGVKVTDLDGNEFYDLTGSYGVNVLGYDFYKAAMARGFERVADARSGAWALSSRRRRQREAAASRFPASTKCRSTCRGPKR